MTEIVAHKPPFVFGYWRPWKQDANFFDSYFDYLRDTSLAKYSADTVGQYIQQASKEQVSAINKLGNSLVKGFDILSNHLSLVNAQLFFINRNLDIQVEQQKLSNLLLKNISELLRIPDSEKERQRSIELGIKFFVNAEKDPDLFDDALEELLKAEELMHQDYFVLHRIGCIYLYSVKHLNPEKALDYFVKAAKYAAVESDPNASFLVSAMNQFEGKNNNDLSKEIDGIQKLISDSYEKAAFASYVLGNFESATNFQSKALKYFSSPQNYFILSKYQLRTNKLDESLKNLEQSINGEPMMVVAVLKDIDMMNEPQVLDLIHKKNKQIETEIDLLIVEMEKTEPSEFRKKISNLIELKKEPYDLRIIGINSARSDLSQIIIRNRNIELEFHKSIDKLISKIKKSIFVTLSQIEKQNLIDDLISSKLLPFNQMSELYKKKFDIIETDSLKIGSRYAGGIVFYLNIYKRYGMVVSEEDLPNAIWGTNGNLGYAQYDDDHSSRNEANLIIEKASWKIQHGLFSNSKYKLITAARVCSECRFNNYDDWYLPSTHELYEIFRNLKQNDYIVSENYYWSSTSYDYDEKSFDFADSARLSEADAFSFKLGIHKKLYRSSLCWVRAVRVFKF